MNRKVLNRPMFARMKTGGLKEILYAQTGRFVEETEEVGPYRPRQENLDWWGSAFDKLKYLSPKYYIGEGIKRNIEAREKIKKIDPDREIGPFENLPFYSGITDWNWRPEVVRPGEKEPEVNDKWRDEQDKRDK